MSTTILTKTPEESRLYNFVFSGTEEIKAGATILSATITTVSGTGLTVGSPAINTAGDTVQVRISSGTDSTRYHLRCDAVTSAGDTLSCCGELHVYEC